jgi:hypothetical protein
MGLFEQLQKFAKGLGELARSGAGGDRPSKDAVFPLSGQPSDSDMDVDMVGDLAESAEPMTPEEWSNTLDQHARFLESGGTGGRWELLSVSGLPLCIYQGAEGRRGEQAVLRLENIAGLDASSAWLSWADLSGAYARGINLCGANLIGSVMIDSWFEAADFTSAKMRDVDLSGARLAGASFRDADLRGADFEAADCSGADFRGADLDGARFPGAVLDDVKF